MAVYNNIMETIGGTPLVRLNRLTAVSYTHLTLPTIPLV